MRGWGEAAEAGRPAAASLVLAVILAGCVPSLEAGGRGTAVPLTPAPTTFQALYRVRAEGPRGRLRVRVWIAVDAGADRVCAEVLGPMGGTRAQMDADPARTRAWLVEEGAYLDEPTGPGTLEAALGLPVSVDEIVQVLRGRRPEGGRRPPAEIPAPGGVVWTASWEFAGGPVPQSLVFRGPGARLELQLLRLEPRSSMPDPFRIPPDAKRVSPESFQALLMP